MPRSTADIIRHAEELADLLESDNVALDKASPELTRAYRQLLDTVVERGRAEEAITGAVSDVRRAGGSWNLIGAVIGVSRQAARQQYVVVDESE